MSPCVLYKYLLRLIDRYHIFLYDYPIGNKDAKSIADIISKQFLQSTGMILRFLSDRGCSFAGEPFQASCWAFPLK